MTEPTKDDNADVANEKPFDDLGEIFADPSFKPPEAPRNREFKPWHRPRKQFVRKQQWGKEIEALITGRQNGDTSLRYLGLPGPDFLDIRYIYSKFCVDGRISSLRFLGFDSSAAPESPDNSAHNVSYHEIRSLPRIDRSSHVAVDDIRRLAEKESLALDKAKELGSFDVVNLDLCGHFAKEPPVVADSFYNAIANICNIQMRHNRSWSLFITSRIDKSEVATETLLRIANRVASLAEACNGLLTQIESSIGLSDLTLHGIKSSDEATFFRAVAAGLGAWLLGLARKIHFELRISSIAGYHISNQSDVCDMLSVVFRFTPYDAIDVDPSRLAADLAEIPSECSQMSQFVAAIERVKDIDSLLQVDENFFEVLLNETGAMLEAARYDLAQYKQWVRDDGSSSNP
ncbi:hypothetical protein ACIA2T_29045 [Amycolatopsis japonica]|uniref:PP_RS20740 family protein n=1 Tax=Amycolatopsis japonica TaxID=208439 RepID=UPI0037B6B378